MMHLDEDTRDLRPACRKRYSSYLFRGHRSPAYQPCDCINSDAPACK